MTCVVCEAATASGIKLCHDCTTRLEQVLAAVPHVLSSMRASLQNQNSRSGSGSGGGDVRQSPMNLTISDYLQTLDSVLTGWTRQLYESVGRDGFRRLIRDRLVYTAILLQNVNVIRRMDWAGACLEELTDVSSKIMWCIDNHPTTILLGKCSECGQGTMRARGAYARCDGCGVSAWTADLKQERLAQAFEHVDSLPVIVRALNQSGYSLKLGTVQKWAQRGKLGAVCHITTRVEGYTPGQVLDLMQRMLSEKV